jgi:hypothetical protein
VALANEQKTLIGQLQRAHRLMKNEQLDAWAMASALYGYATQQLSRVLLAVDWTDDGEYKVLEASLVIEGRAIPVYCRAVPTDEYAGRQTTVELAMWYALMAMRRDGQTVVVVADRGFAKFAWLGPCPEYPWMHLVIRLKANTILTWDDMSAPLRDWPLWAGETVEIEQAQLGAEDFNTTQPVFVEIALVQPNGTVQVVLPRQRLGSVPYALQAADAAVDERLVNVEGDTMTGPLQIQASLHVGSGGPPLGAGDAFVAGSLQVGASSLVLNGSGIRFPDATFQTTAGLASVMHDATLMGTGMSGSPLGIANGGVGTDQLATNAVTAAKIAPGQVVKSLNGMFDNVTLTQGSNITITPSGNMLTLAAPNALSSISHNATLMGNGTGGMPLGVAIPLSLSGATAISVMTVTNTGSGISVFGSSVSDAGVLGSSSSGDGVFGQSLGGTEDAGVRGIHTGNGIGVRGEATSANGTGVFGIGSALGVIGSSTNGHGVVGNSTGGDGVQGTSGGDANDVGVQGIHNGNGDGVRGTSLLNGPGVVGVSVAGNLFEGRRFGVRFRVRNDGQVRSDVGFTTPAADFAEMMEVEEAIGPEANSYQPGDVLIISPETGKLTTGRQPYCPLVAGVYSTQPGFLGGQRIDEERLGQQVPLAVIGIVPCKVTSENGPIAIGDLLVTSSTPGHAMRGTDRSLMLGAIVGKALEPLASGTGTIKVLVTLQ